jgi:hypothetical protein
VITATPLGTAAVTAIESTLGYIRALEMIVRAIRRMGSLNSLSSEQERLLLQILRDHERSMREVAPKTKAAAEQIHHSVDCLEQAMRN